MTFIPRMYVLRIKCAGTWIMLVARENNDGYPVVYTYIADPKPETAQYALIEDDSKHKHAEQVQNGFGDVDGPVNKTTRDRAWKDACAHLDQCAQELDEV